MARPPLNFVPRRRRPVRRALGVFSVCALTAALGGCLDEPLRYVEAKEIDEKITEAELATFLRIIRSLPERTLPAMPFPFAPPPAWDESRTLPVADLVIEEFHAIDQRWSVDWQARQLADDRPLHRALRREEMTPAQFAGIASALAAALGRERLPPRTDLDDVILEGRIVVDELRADPRPFHSLPPEVRHFVLRQAMWIARIDRAERLRQVPPENLTLVRRHRDVLSRIFPPEYHADPLAGIADLFAEHGIPFEELPEGGSDAHIEWDPAEAIVGRDEPDAEFGASP
ncbi:MAG: hypothetical protein WD066_07030 [Planctomycetaceae bacterium]